MYWLVIFYLVTNWSLYIIQVAVHHKYLNVPTDASQFHSSKKVVLFRLVYTHQRNKAWSLFGYRYFAAKHLTPSYGKEHRACLHFYGIKIAHTTAFLICALVPNIRPISLENWYMPLGKPFYHSSIFSCINRDSITSLTCWRGCRW